MDEEMPKPMIEAETLVKDRFHDYLMVATDGDNVYCIRSSTTAAIGLGRYAQLIAEETLTSHA